ncbi:MAG: hypothetical protein VW518_00630 [Burkholderiaceae bacterium]
MNDFETMTRRKMIQQFQRDHVRWERLRAAEGILYGLILSAWIALAVIVFWP